LGQAVSKILLARGDINVRGFSRDEQKLQSLESHPKLKLDCGDIRDFDRCLQLSTDCDIVLHLAALKHVDLLEDNPGEALRTNVEGTRNLIKAFQWGGGEKFVLASTDKACYPINAYGCSKALAEKFVLQLGSKGLVVRYGNVIGSRGSVIPKFVKTLMEEQCIRITDTRMSRFWIQIEEVAQFFVDKAFGKHSGLWIPEMKAATLPRVVQAVRDCCYDSVAPRVDIIGMRPGEKIHETLITKFDGLDREFDLTSDNAPQFTRTELQQYVKPCVESCL
jgi:FlaA1/EpsC-like NDP-sugar epimerase